MQGLNGWLQARFGELQQTERGRIIASKLQVMGSVADSVVETETRLPQLLGGKYRHVRVAFERDICIGSKVSH